MSSSGGAASSRRSRSRSKERERSSRKHHSSRSRSRERDRERDRKHRSRSPKRSRSRSRSRDRKKDHKKDKKSSKDSSRELERALKKAHKALKHGDAAALSGLDPALLDQMLAEQKAKASSATKDKDREKDSKHGKKHRRRDSSSDESSDSDDDAAAEEELRKRSPFLSDGQTPRLFRSDYFARSTEFRVWLSESKGEHVDDIPSKKARKRFAQFVDAWNARKLADKYYKGIDSSALSAAGVMTKHKWKLKLSDAEKLALESTRDAIDSDTHHHTYAQAFQGKRGADPEGMARIKEARGGSAAAASAAAAAPARETPEERDARHRCEKLASKRAAADTAVLMEELAPKATGREAMLEKRAAKGAYAHADRDAGGLDASWSDKDLMGSGGASDFQAALARQKGAQASRAAEGQAKLSEHQQREKEKMQKLLASIGMQDKYNIQ